MTEKAEQIMKRMREKDRKRRALSLLNDPRHRNRLLESLNRDTMDAAAPVGNGQMTILKDMESLDQEHDQYMENLRLDRAGIQCGPILKKQAILSACLIYWTSCVLTAVFPQNFEHRK